MITERFDTALIKFHGDLRDDLLDRVEKRGIGFPVTVLQVSEDVVIKSLFLGEIELGNIETEASAELVLPTGVSNPQIDRFISNTY